MQLARPPAEDDPADHCVSCRLTGPILDRPKTAARLRDIESAKRRVFFVLQEFDLPLEPKSESNPAGLAFDLLESLPGESPVLTGHAEG